MPIFRRQQKGVTFDVVLFLSVLWKRKWIILFSGVFLALLTFLGTIIFSEPEYVTSATLYANNAKSTDMNTMITSAELNASARLVDTYSAIILSDPVLEQVIAENDLNITASGLSKRISIASVNATEVFKVKVKYTSPETTAKIANSIADIAPVKIAEIVDGCSVKVISYAKVPAGRSKIDYQTGVTKGFWTGILLSVAIIFLILVLDTRVKGDSDLEEWELPVLGIIPLFEEAEKSAVSGYKYREYGKNEHIQ